MTNLEKLYKALETAAEELQDYVDATIVSENEYKEFCENVERITLVKEYFGSKLTEVQDLNKAQ